ncbi:MAG: class I SAM-dependent RNA methyltransferase [Clostridia bacterium]|nr:class I SAM-dependent RNA methyltransferase [Clostridia bacterium]
MEFIASTSYALEGVTARELQDLGLEVLDTQTSRVRFWGSALDGCRANLFLRTAGRVRLVLGSFPAQSFDELYDQVYALPLSECLPKNAAFPVSARTVNSQLTHEPSCQRIVKKAIADNLCRAYHLHEMPENGVSYPIETHIWRNQVTLSLDLSGEPLHKRGYRDLNGPAALRETTAAALILLTHWNGDTPFLDPFCGSGTIPIEAALYARDIAPGFGRRFGAEQYPLFPASIWKEARQEVADRIDFYRPLEIIGADIDPSAIRMSKHHAARAGVDSGIRFIRQDVRSTASLGEYGTIVTNPPYGERMSDEKTVRDTMHAFGTVFRSMPTWSCHVISALPHFESAFGKKPSHRRVVRNGPLSCTYYQYYGPRKP